LESVHLNRSGKKHSSGVGLPLLAVTKVKKKTFLGSAKNLILGTSHTIF